jgi:hypothetical protein
MAAIHMMDKATLFSRKAIQQENKANPTYRSTKETMPQGLDNKVPPSTKKSPKANPWINTAVMAKTPMPDMIFAVFI